MTAVITGDEPLLQNPRRTKPRRPKRLSFSTHKARARWFENRETWPFRDVNMTTFRQERGRFDAQPTPHSAHWVQAGPTNLGGRMTSLAVDPTDPDRLIAGAAGGGVWASDDAGRSWRPLWHRNESLNVGAVAMDPQDATVIYVGTGEANLSADSHPGVGIFVSRDGGATWARLADADAADIPTRIGTIAVDPTDSNHLLLGGVSHASTDVREGLYRSTDGGVSWSRETGISTGRYRCHEIRFVPGSGQRLYATIDARGIKTGLWRSTNGGSDWSQLTNGLPSGDQIGRGAVAIAPSDPNRLYVQFSDPEGGVFGIFRSDDGGGSWQSVAGSHFGAERQMSYNNTIVVHPTDPDHVLCGGVEIHRSLNGGASWQRRTRWHVDVGDDDYAHADQHALVMPGGAAAGRVYAMNDGGMDVSEDGGTIWENRSSGLEVCMFYDFNVAQSDVNFYGGGMQDQGTNITTAGAIDDHFRINGGDGGWFEVDPGSPLHFYTSSQGMRILRFRGDQANPWKDVSPLPPGPERQGVWMVYITMDPNDPDRVFTGTKRVFRTLDDGETWSAVSGALDGSVITAIEVSRNDGDRIYVGTENGGVFRSVDGGDGWSGDLSGPNLPGRIVTRIAAHPDDTDTVYCTVAGFGHRHLFRSIDGGLTWTDADRGQLPDAPHHAVVFSRKNTDHLFVSHDLGVSASLDGGESWDNITGDLPSQMVVDLTYHEGQDRLFAATYGRSAWSLDLHTLS